MPEVIFGNTAPAKASLGLGNSIIGNIHTCPSDGYAKSITVDLGGCSRAKAALYDGDTLGFIAESDEVIGGPDGPRELTLPNTPQVFNGKKYLLVAKAPDGQFGVIGPYTGNNVLVLALPYSEPFPS